MSTLTEREKIKHALYNKGITDWSDNDIDNFIERNRDKLQPLLLRPVTEIPGQATELPASSAGSEFYTPAFSRSLRKPQERSSAQPVPFEQLGTAGAGFGRKDKNVMWDFVGNAAWNLLDSATFGVAGWVDPNDMIEDALTGGGPETSWGSIGAAAGGLAGFLVPFSVAKKAVGLGARTTAKAFGTRSVDDAAKSVLAKGSQTNKTPLSILQKRYKKFNKLSDKEQSEVLEPISHYIKNEIPKISSKKSREIFDKNWRKALENSLEEQMKSKGIKLGLKAKNDVIDNIIKTTGIDVGKGLPISNLQQLIARGFGNGKWGEIAATALEEGTIFAAAESIPHIIHNLRDNKEWHEDMGGAMSHAFALGNVFGGLKYVAGGRDLKILRTGFKRVSDLVKGKKPYSAYDLTKSGDRDMLAGWSISVLRASERAGHKDQIFSTIKDTKITSANDIRNLIKDGKTGKGTESDKIAGARVLRDFLVQTEKNWNKNWWGEFIKETGADLYGSTPRMLMASAAMNFDMEYGLLPLRDDVPLADKIYHILVGAFMGKRGKTLEYIDKTGKRVVSEPTEKVDLGDDFVRMNDFMNILGTSPENMIFQGILSDTYLRSKYIRPDAEHADIQSLREVLQKHNVIVSSDKAHKKMSSPQATEARLLDNILSQEAKIDNEGNKYYTVGDQVFKSFDGMQNWLKTSKGMSIVRNLAFSMSAERSKGIEGHHPVYEQLDLIGSRTFLKEGERLEQVDEVSPSRLRKIEKDLSDLRLETIEKGIDTISDIDDIMLNASDVKMSSLVETLKNSVSELYSQLTGEKPTIENGILYVGNIVKGVGKGAETTSEQARIIGGFESAVNMLSRIGSVKRLEVDVPYEAKNLEGLKEVGDKVNRDINLEINKTENISDKFAVELGEGWVNQLVESQAYYKSFRKMYDMLGDTDGSKFAWTSQLGKENIAQDAHTLINSMMLDSAGMLVKDWSVKDGRPADLEKNMGVLRSLRRMMEMMPHYRKNRLTEYDYDIDAKVVHASDIRKLKKLFSDANMNIFDRKDPNIIQNFSNDVANFALDKFIKVSTKVHVDAQGRPTGEAAPLTATDKAKIAYLIDTGLADYSGTIIDLQLENPFLAIKPTDRYAQEVMTKIKKAASTRYVLGDFLNDKEAFRIEDINEVWRAELEKVVKDMNVPDKEVETSVVKMFTEMMFQYEKHIAPYIKTAESKGGMFTKGGEGVVTWSGIMEFKNHLDALEMMSNRNAHESFIESLTRNVNIEEHSKTAKKLLSDLHQRYYYGNMSSTRAIKILKDKDLYDPEKGVLTFEEIEDKLPLEQRIRHAMKILKNTLPDGSTEVIIENRIRQHMSKLEKEFESDIFKQMTEEDFLNKYGIDPLAFKEPIEEWGINTVRDVIKSGKIQREKDGDMIHYDQMESGERFDLMMDAMNMYFTKQSARNVPRLIVDEQAGPILDSENIEFSNPLFRFLNGMLTDSEFTIIDTDITTQNGFRSIRSDVKVMEMFTEMLSGKGPKGLLRAGLGADHLGIHISRQDHGYIPVLFGDMKWAIGIPDKVSTLNSIAESFYKYVDNIEKNHKGERGKKIVSKLKAFRKDRITREKVSDNDYTYKYEDSGHAENMKNMTLMVNHLFLNKSLPGLWIENLKDNIADADAGIKLIRRIRLMSNTSNKTITEDVVDNAIVAYGELYSTNKLQQQAFLEVAPKVKETIKGLANLKKRGVNLAIVKDEDNAFFSTFDRIREQMKKEKLGEYNEKQFEKQIADERGADASLADSYMVVRPELWAALKAIYGVDNVNGIGGMKPNISRIGNKEGILLGKTAFVPDSRMQAFFDKNKNIDAVLMQSGEKLKNPDLNIVDDIVDSWDSFSKIKVRDKFNNIDIEDISIGSVVNSKKDATISYQLQTELDKEAANEFFDWVVSPSLKEYKTVAPSKFSKYSPEEAIAFSRSLVKNRGGGLDAPYTKWVNNNGIPFAGPFLQTYKAQAKRHYLDDKILSMKTKLGSQSVLSPSLGSDHLRNTLFTFDPTTGEASVHTIGQVEIASWNRNKNVDLRKIHIIKNMARDKDSILTWEEFKKEARNVDKNFLLKFRDKRIRKLGHLYDTIESMVNSKQKDIRYEIAIAGWRPPSAKSSDKVISGLRGFVEESSGNQARLNVADLMLRIEGDFDIDKYNYWWDTPTKVLKAWEKNSAKVLAIAPEKKENKTSTEGFDWTNPESIMDYNINSGNAAKMRGVVVKTRRLVQFLTNYHAFEADRKSGFAIKPADGGMISIPEDRVEMAYNILSRDIQNIVDSTQGYNMDVYNKGWLEKFLFGGLIDTKDRKWKGLFVKEKAAKRKDEEGRTVWEYDKESLSELSGAAGEVYRAMIMDAVNSYRGFLQLGSNIYEGGVAKSVRYDDILSSSNLYNSRVVNINQQSYIRLLRNPPGNMKKSAWKIALDQVYKSKAKVAQFQNPFGSFGFNVSLKDNKNMLPFDRAMLAITNADAFHVDGPIKMFGDKLATFEEYYGKYLTAEKTEKWLGDVLNDIKADVGKIGFINYLDFKIKKQTNSKFNAIKDENGALAGAIEEDLSSLKKMKTEIEDALIHEPKVAEFVKNAAKSRVVNRIYKTLRAPFIGKEFENIAHVTRWLGKKVGQKAIEKEVKRRPFNIKGIDSHEYMDTLIWNEIFKKFKDIYIDPSGGNAKELKAFEKDVYQFKQFVRKQWKDFFDDKRRYAKKNTWKNEEALLNIIDDKFKNLFDRWETGKGGRPSGLGKLFLWKIMAPEHDVGTFTYFNGMFTEGFSNVSPTFVKFGLRWLANPKNKDRISKIEVDNLYKTISGLYNNYYKMFHGQPNNSQSLDPKVLFEDAKSAMENITGAESVPLRDIFGEVPSEGIRSSTNPMLSSVFGYNTSETIGYIMTHNPIDPGIIRNLKLASHYNFIPSAFIPTDFQGGDLPSIRGYGAYNKAMENNARVFLGNSLKKGTLFYRDLPVARLPFEKTGGVTMTEKQGDLKATVSSKRTNKHGDTVCL